MLHDIVISVTESETTFDISRKSAGYYDIIVLQRSGEKLALFVNSPILLECVDNLFKIDSWCNNPPTTKIRSYDGTPEELVKEVRDLRIVDIGEVKLEFC